MKTSIPTNPPTPTHYRGTVIALHWIMFGLLIAVFAGKNSDLDQECVLYGDLETSILDQVIVGEYLYGTRAILQLLPLTIVLLIVIILSFVLIGFLSP